MVTAGAVFSLEKSIDVVTSTSAQWKNHLPAKDALGKAPCLLSSLAEEGTEGELGVVKCLALHGGTDQASEHVHLLHARSPQRTLRKARLEEHRVAAASALLTARPRRRSRRGRSSAGPTRFTTNLHMRRVDSSWTAQPSP